MRDLLFKVWNLAKPYRWRMFWGVLMGVLNGLIAPLLIGTVMFVYAVVFPVADTDGDAQLPMRRLPGFLQHWFFTARDAFVNGAHAHPWTLAMLIAAIPLVMILRGLTGYLNVYFLQWAASRTVAD
ncbi:MAG TPA: hypothetical protein VK769_02310, partial [Verrucomicrobiae bacterium]|nr:hypothetical protein [Verrucomicrobiae bacterium]